MCHRRLASAPRDSSNNSIGNGSGSSGSSGNGNGNSSLPASSGGDGSAAWHTVTVTRREALSPDTQLVHVALPAATGALLSRRTLPWSVKIRAAVGDAVLDKSYSPVSLPLEWGHAEKPTVADLTLLVKRYPPSPGGGLGAYICSRTPGQVLSLRVKPEVTFHGEPYYPNRWQKLSLVAAGTGIAPLFQLARGILANPDDQTEMALVFCNRRASDVLFRQQMDRWAAEYPHRFRVQYVLSQPKTDGTPAEEEVEQEDDGDGWRRNCDQQMREHSDLDEKAMEMRANTALGRVTADILGATLFPPTGSTGGDAGASRHVLVCGQDQFLDTVCGRHVRTHMDGSARRKLQGPLLGALRALGYAEHEVSKL